MGGGCGELLLMAATFSWKKAAKSLAVRVVGGEEEG